MKTGRPLQTGLVALLSVCTLWAASSKKDEWRKVLGFDVMATESSHEADLGSHRRLVARWEPDLRWEIEVTNYGDKERENLLYDGNNWHGVQPWMVFAWTKQQQTYPDVREVAYDRGRSQTRIVLVGCQARQVGNNRSEFVKGRVEVFHRP